jgi:hypothetical protein
LRIHRFYLVNVERVSKLEPYTKDSHIVILMTEHVSPSAAPATAGCVLYSTSRI